jgi:hypothetical protein
MAGSVARLQMAASVARMLGNMPTIHGSFQPQEKDRWQI